MWKFLNKICIKILKNEKINDIWLNKNLEFHQPQKIQYFNYL